MFEKIVQIVTAQFQRNKPSSTSICVAGLSGVGKTCVLRSLVDYNEPYPRWAQPKGLAYLRKKTGYNVAATDNAPALDPALTARGTLPPSTVNPGTLLNLVFTPKKGPTFRVDVNDIAGTQFEWLANPPAQGGEHWTAYLNFIDIPPPTNGVQAQSQWQENMSYAQSADILLIMLAPEDFEDRVRLNKVVRSIKTISANAAELVRTNAKHSPSVYVVFTKVDQYGQPWKFWQGLHSPKAAMKKLLWMKNRELLASIDAIFVSAGQLAGASGVQVAFCSAWPEDPSFGKTYDESLAAANHEREGWDRRGVPALFRDCFDFLYHQRGHPQGLFSKVLFLVITLFSAVLLHDAIRGHFAYRQKWAQIETAVANDGMKLERLNGKPAHERKLEILKTHFTLATGSTGMHRIFIKPEKDAIPQSPRQYEDLAVDLWDDPALLITSVSSTGRLRLDLLRARQSLGTINLLQYRNRLPIEDGGELLQLCQSGRLKWVDPLPPPPPPPPALKPRKKASLSDRIRRIFSFF